jgi:hypothetical protein
MHKNSNRKTFLFSALALAVSFVGTANAQEYRFNPEHRRPVEATVHDLEGIGERNSFSHGQQERYDHAIIHLQQFAERLHERGHFDKGKLDQAINDVQNVIDHNPMSPGAHELLVRDVTELRRLRERFDDRYRYPY